VAPFLAIYAAISIAFLSFIPAAEAMFLNIFLDYSSFIAFERTPEVAIPLNKAPTINPVFLRKWSPMKLAVKAFYHQELFFSASV